MAGITGTETHDMEPATATPVSPAADAPASGRAERSGVAVALVFASLMMVAFATLDIPLYGQVVLSTCFIAVGYWIATRAPELRIGLAFVSVAVSLRYLFWRGAYSLDLRHPLDLTVAWALYLAEIYGFAIMVLGYFQTSVLRPRRPTPLPPEPASWPTVDIFIPTYSESPDIVRRTLIGALAIRYPHKTVHLLDDGRRPAMRELAEELGVHYRIRKDNSHAKAGNINAALADTNGELVAIFDCDHVPVRSFLDVTVGAFVADPKMALVQTPHHFYNPDPFERNLVLEGQMPTENAVFYHAVQIGNDFWNSVLFCGSCAVIRRTALEEAGGIAVETVTEDAHTSLRMLANGWKGAYLDIPQAAGLATERYAFHVAQRIRWARGMTQILRLDNPLTKKGLSIPQRLNYLNAILHFQFGVPRLIFYLAPVSYLVFGLHPLAANPWEMLAYVLPHMMLAVMGGTSSSRGMRHAFWAEVYETALAPYIAVVTLLALVFPRHGKFNVTVKGAQLDRAQFDWNAAAPNLVVLIVCVVGLVATPWQMLDRPQEIVTLGLTAAFNAYNVLVLLAAVAVALERPQQRRAHRVRREVAARVWDPACTRVLAQGRTRDITEEGLGLVVPADTKLPREVSVSLQTDHGWSAPFAVRVMSTFVAGGEVNVGMLMDTNIGIESRRAIIETMFSAPDSWTVKGQHATASSALVEIVKAPWRAVTTNWRGRREPERAA